MLMIVSALLCIGTAAGGDAWPNWRGPHFNGSSRTTQLPDTLEPEAAAWAVALPGPGAATPAVADGRVVVTSTQRGGEALTALCLDAADGTILWQKTLAHGDQRFGRNTQATPSPIVDDQHVYLMFGTGDLVCLTHDGAEVWRRNLVADYGPFSILFGYGSSPLLFEGILYVPVIRRPTIYRGPKHDEPLVSYLLAVDAASGKTVFYQERPSDAVDETTNSYITPVVATVGGAPRIVLFAADYLTTHDPKTGRELTRYQYDASKNDRARNVPTPIADGAMLYVTLPRGTAALAFDLNDADEPLRWTTDARGPDAASPTLYKGSFYMIDDRTKRLVCIDPSDGSVRWRGQLDQSGMYYAALTAADDKLYAVNEAGVVSVAAADPEAFRLLSTTAFGQSPVYATIAVADGRVYVRTAETLYCFENKSTDDNENGKTGDRQ